MGSLSEDKEYMEAVLSAERQETRGVIFER